MVSLNWFMMALTNHHGTLFYSFFIVPFDCWCHWITASIPISKLLLFLDCVIVPVFLPLNIARFGCVCLCFCSVIVCHLILCLILEGLRALLGAQFCLNLYYLYISLCEQMSAHSTLWCKQPRIQTFSTGQLTRLFARSFALAATHLLTPHCLLHSRAPLHSLICSLAHIAHSRACGKVAILSVFFSILEHSAVQTC